MLRIFHFILDHRVGGPHIYVQSLAKALSEDVTSTLVTTGRGEATQLALTNLRHRFRGLYPIEVIWNVLRLLWLFRSGPARRRCIFDVHGAANIAPVLAARILRIPLVWHFHETMNAFRGLAGLGKAILPGSMYRIVVVAKRAAEVFRISDAELIPGSIDASFWRPAASEREAREQDPLLRLVVVGNLNPLKGIDVLLDAVGRMGRTWELVVVGSELSTFRGYAQMLCEKGRALTGGEGSVRFVGWQSSESVRRLLASAHVFVLPSRSEACPIALLEAMAMECVCVATDVGDVREIIEGPELGIVVASGSAEQLREALDRVSRMDAAGRREMGVRARDRIVARHSVDVMAKRHLAIYRTLIPK